MKTEDFQQQILSQIGVHHLAEALTVYENNPKKATSKMVYILASASLENPYEADSYMLFTMLLEKAKIPSSLLDLLRLNTGLKNAVSDATWNYFYNYTFTGQIETSFSILNSTMAPSANPLYQIVAEDVIIDVLSNPLNMLMGFIDHVATLWKRHRAMGTRTYFLPTSHSELFVFIEACVAKYYGAESTVEAGIVPTANNIFIGYRFIGAINKNPVDDAFLTVARQSAFLQASNTL